MQQRDSAMTERTVKMGPVVVTGGGHHQHLREAATPVHVITQRDITQTGASTFQDVVTRLMPQVSAAPNSMGSFLRMNGLGNKYVLILVNGHRVIGDISGNIDLQRINMARVRRIEVLDGAASSLYGSDAIGGVINIITDQPTSDLIAATNDTRISGKGQFRESINLDAYKKGFGSYTSWTRDQAASYRTNDYEYVKGNEGDVQRTVAPLFPGYRSDVANQTFTYNPNKRLALRLDGQYGRKCTDRPNTSDEVKGGFDYEMQCESWRVGAGAVYKLGKRNSLQFDFVRDDYEYGYDYEVATKTNQVGDYAVKKQQHYYEGEVKGIFHFTEKSTTIFGLDYRNDYLMAVTSNVHRHVNTYAAYAQHEHPLAKNLKGTVGLRLTHHETFGTELTPKVALMYSPGQFRLRTTYSRGFRAPGLDELYYHYNTYSRGVSTITKGNTALDPEKSNYISLNAEYHHERFSLSATGYANLVNDMIVKQYVPVDATNLPALRAEFPEITDEQAAKIDQYGLYQTSDKGRIYGLQLNGTVEIVEGLTLAMNYAFTHARSKSGDTWEHLERSIRHTGTLVANYRRAWKPYTLSVTLNGRLQSKTYYNGKYDDAPGFGLWNLMTTHTFHPARWTDIDVNLGVDNLFNHVDRRIDSSTRRYALYSPGTLLVAGLKVKLKKLLINRNS